MMILKKKEIIAAALVVLIGAAGYLNWSYQDEIRVTDGDIYTETGKRLGEAQYVNTTKKDVEDTSEDKENIEKGKDSKNDAKKEDADTTKTTSASEDSFAAARVEKENARSKSLEILNQTATNESFDDDTRKKAQERILKMADNVEKEASIENIARAKGYNDIAVYIDGESVDMLIKKAELSEDDIVRLKEIASGQLKIGASDIKIVQVQ